ncbi:serpin-type proteinase inhibitor 16 [Vairimorpha necatrix]|uniref:Serpin-type proteinase inhibitor 16 n=1 Tax=Vairimorpha necatrix TaxID=6039 RepID=A0AAX4JD91_9MICR
MKKFIQGITNLSIKFLDIMLSGDSQITSNQAISPYSFSQVFGILSNDQNHVSKKRYMNRLGFKSQDNKFNENSKEFNENLVEDNKNRKNIFLVKNFLLHRNDVKINENTEKIINEFYNSTVTSYDPYDTEQELKKINEMVAGATYGNIKEALKSIIPRTTLSVVNTLYMKYEWFNQFDYSSHENFVSFSGQNRQEMMYKISKFDVYQDDTKMAVKMHFKDSNFKNGKKTIKKLCDEKELDKILTKMKYKNIELIFPKFKIESESDLSDFYKELRIENLLKTTTFDSLIENLNFKKLTIKQKLSLDINEGGISIQNSIPPAITNSILENVEVFKFNTPFLWFVIKHDAKNNTNTPIIMGKYTGQEK